MWLAVVVQWHNVCNILSSVYLSFLLIQQKNLLLYFLSPQNQIKFCAYLVVTPKQYPLTQPYVVLPGFYRAMHFSAKRGIAIACRLSVCLSVCYVGEL